MRGRGGGKKKTAQAAVSEVWAVVCSSIYKILFRGHIRSQTSKTRSQCSDHLTTPCLHPRRWDSSEASKLITSAVSNSSPQFRILHLHVKFHFTFQGVSLLLFPCLQWAFCFPILYRDFQHIPQSTTTSFVVSHTNDRRNASLHPTLDSIIKILS